MAETLAASPLRGIRGLPQNSLRVPITIARRRSPYQTSHFGATAIAGAMKVSGCAALYHSWRRQLKPSNDFIFQNDSSKGGVTNPPVARVRIA